ncbi:hypothetical protein ENSA5_48840 [Enhygromyxa salina]|uniref:Uncharacterized protein n=1 Tax=Enhygromyxa salina TaxID=215803 RepID=A0A2S9XHW5_9BACT|nr:hypothetical protein [Enhygromyxa salina]PRP92466.1 hypothetical protein ENSA5_48840 [Enhygromyxa salina]
MSSSDEIDLDPKVPGAAAVGGPSAANPVGATHGVEAPASTQASAEIAEALASGRIDALAAQELLIDQVLAEQLPADLPPAQLERLRAELAALLSEDPNLASLLSPV